MKPVLAFAFASTIAGAACGGDPAPSFPELDASRDAWTTARDDSGGDYSYVRYSDSWTTVHTETTIEVSDGVVVRRAFVMTDSEGTLEQWAEVGAEIGSHDSGHEPLTIDELYDLCEAEVMIHDEPGIEVVFRAFDDGTLRECFYVDSSLEDDNASGIWLERIDLEPEPCGVAALLPCG